MGDHSCGEHCTPENCFKAKLAYWRQNGVPGMFLGGPGMRADFREQPSVAERERRHVEELRAKGVDFERAS